MLLSVAGRLIKANRGREILLKYALPKTIEDGDVFDAMVLSKAASCRNDAIRLAGRAFPPNDGGRWIDLAQWVVEYERVQTKQLDPAMRESIFV